MAEQSSSIEEKIADIMMAMDDPSNAGRMMIFKDQNEPKEDTMRKDGRITGPWFLDTKYLVLRLPLLYGDYRVEGVEIERKEEKNFADTISNFEYRTKQIYKAKDGVRVLGRNKYCTICEGSRDSVIGYWIHCNKEKNLIPKLEYFESLCRVVYAKDRADAERIALKMFEAQRTDIDID